MTDTDALKTRKDWLRINAAHRVRPEFEAASRKSFYQAGALLRDNPSHSETLTQAYARLMNEKAENFRRQSARYGGNIMLAAIADAIEEAAQRAVSPRVP